MNRIYFLEVGPVSEGCDYSSLLPYVSDYKKEKLLKRRFEYDKKIRIYADIILRCLLAGHLRKRFNDLEIKESANGKPYIAGNERVEFNLSHTKTAVAIALSDKPVGIDIEKIREIQMSIAEHVCSEKELSWLREAGADQTLRFFDIWTQKEACLKYDGRGISGNLKTMDVLSDQAPAQLSTFHENGYVISVCSNEKCAPDDFCTLTENKLFDMVREYVC